VLQDLRAIQCWPLGTRLALMWVGLGAAYLVQIPMERDWPGEPFLLFLLVVIGTTLCFGRRFGLISAALSVFLSLYFFEPVGSPTLRYASDLNKIVLYAIIAFGCVVSFAFAEVRTEQVEARRALAESETRFRAAFENAAVGVVLVDPNGSIFRANGTFARMLGYSAMELETKTFQDITHPDDLAANLSVLKKTLTGEANSYCIEKRYVRKDGRFIWASLTVGCVRKLDGAVDYFLSVIEDITDRKLAEARLAERNAQFDLAGKIARIGSFMYDDGTKILQLSPGCAAIYGLPEGTLEISREDWRARVHPDDLPQLDAVARRAFTNGEREFVLEFRIFRHCQVRWIESRVLISCNEAGKPVRRIGAKIDVAERKQAELALAERDIELDHRVKNALSTASAVVSQTRQGSGSFADFVAALDGRIRSMATTHELLSSHRWHGVSLMELVRRELAPYATRNNTEINGPSVLLKPETAQAMAMVLHELATNAAKYGALSTKNGRVSIRWDRHLNGRPRSHLVFEWQEIGGPPVVAVSKSSYGTSTIRDLIPYEFGGAADFVLAPEGVRCRLELPSDGLPTTSLIQRSALRLASFDGTSPPRPKELSLSNGSQ
jgi:PAS domain S-box-containing protein